MLEVKYHRLRNFCAEKFSCVKFLCPQIFCRIDHTYNNLTCTQTSEQQVAPSCIEQQWRSLKWKIFCTFNFRSLRQVQKLANYEIFQIYGTWNLRNAIQWHIAQSEVEFWKCTVFLCWMLVIWFEQVFFPTNPICKLFYLKSFLFLYIFIAYICMQVMKRNEKGETLLHVAAIEGNVSRVKQLLQDVG